MRRDATHGMITVPLDTVVMSRHESNGKFVGRAAVYNRRAAIGDPKTWGFWEQISPGAFDRALAEDQDVVLLFNHNYDHLLARTSSGTMTLSSDKKGLVVEATIAPTAIGQSVRNLIERGDLSKMSFGFTVPDLHGGQRWEVLKDGTELRTVLDADLDDTSVVTRPAYADTEASMRSAVEAARTASPLRRARWEEAHARFAQIKAPRGF